MLVELAVAMAMEHDGVMRLMIPCDQRIMAKKTENSTCFF